MGFWHSKHLSFTLAGIVLLVFGLMPINALAAQTPSVQNLNLASVHAAIVDLDSGETLHEKYAETSVPIASLTKMMTALVILESDQPLDEYITIVERHRPTPVNAYSRIRIGSEAKREDLVRIALMASENLAAYVLARHYPGGFDAFINAMNDKAQSLGMSNTRFVDPAGLSSDNRASASDMARLLAAAWKHEKIRELSTTRYFGIWFQNPRYELRYGNTNVLVHRNRWDLELTKTGYLDAAGRCLMMATTVDGRTLGVVFLDSFGKRTPLGDAGRVRRWLETGNSGAVAGAARRYEREQVQALNDAGNTEHAMTDNSQ
jgi:D-alanyl-D-alanine endopeptidase (penicillin-binding protein 7)